MTDTQKKNHIKIVAIKYLFDTGLLSKATSQQYEQLMKLIENYNFPKSTSFKQALNIGSAVLQGFVIGLNASNLK